MKNKFHKLFQSSISVVLIMAFTSCNLSTPEPKDRAFTNTVKTTVAKSIDNQMSNIKDQLEPDLQAKIDSGKGPMTGKEIVNLTLEEKNGCDYIDFCYDVTTFHSDTDPDSVLESARPLMSEDQFNQLEMDVKSIQKAVQDFAIRNEKAIRSDQKQAFYNDLKSLVTKTSVMLTAGIVYAVIPDTILWGKVSAAAAIAIGAGLVANITMSIYQKYKLKDAAFENYTIKQWLTELIKDPKADYALAAAAFATASTVTENPVTRGIVVCIFGLTDALDIFDSMMQKYNFYL